jgi:hypothetical protein
MEVHHHSHTERKKWTHYFWEFFMLFLAVTLGFFVENQREHYVEHQRERKYISSLIADIKNDTAELNRNISIREIKTKQADTLIRLLMSGRYKELGSDTYFLALVLRSVRFTNSDGTMQQLKNAGGLRLIRKQFIIDSIMKYDYRIRALLLQVDREQESSSRFRELAGEIFDAEVFYNVIDTAGDRPARPGGNPQLLTYDRITINKFAVEAQRLASLLRLNLRTLKTLNAFAIRLIQFLQEEYHLSEKLKGNRFDY